MPFAGGFMPKAHPPVARRGHAGVTGLRGAHFVVHFQLGRCYTAEQEDPPMKTKHLVLAGLLALAALTAQARSTVPVVNHQDVLAVRSTGLPASADRIRAAFLAAGAARGWQIAVVEPGKLLGTLNVRGKHTVSADITYADGKFSVRYRDSINMNYTPGGDGNGLIHPSYNKWVDFLMQDVRVELARS
jgi:hypothetical protein